MPLRAILRLAFNLSSPVVMFLFKWTAPQWELKSAIWTNVRISETSQVIIWFDKVGLVGQRFKIDRHDNNLHKMPPNLAPNFMTTDDETIHCENIFSIWATFRLRVANQYDWQSSDTMLISSEIFCQITKDNPHWSPDFGCPPHYFLLITWI